MGTVHQGRDGTLGAGKGGSPLIRGHSRGRLPAKRTSENMFLQDKKEPSPFLVKKNAHAHESHIYPVGPWLRASEVGIL